MKNKNIQNLPESYSKFVVKFKANIDRLNKTKETIFESTIDSSQITDAVLLEHYNYFVKNYQDILNKVFCHYHKKPQTELHLYILKEVG